MPWKPNYATRAQATGYIRLRDDEDDAQIDLALGMASRAIDRHCLRQFGNTGALQARRYKPRWSGSRNAWLVRMDDVQNVAGLTVGFDSAYDGTFVTPVTGYLLQPDNAAEDGMPYERLVFAAPSGITVTGATQGVKVTAIFGWTAVPDAVTEACLLQVSRLHLRRDAPFGVAGSPSDGSELRLLAKLDPDVAVGLDHYRRRVKVL
jgi:hypothetical protein